MHCSAFFFNQLEPPRHSRVDNCSIYWGGGRYNYLLSWLLFHEFFARFFFCSTRLVWNLDLVYLAYCLTRRELDGEAYGGVGVVVVVVVVLACVGRNVSTW